MSGGRLVSTAGGPYDTSPIVYGDYYYTLLDCGSSRPVTMCGKEIYGKTRFPEVRKSRCPRWAYNGKVFCLSEDGDTYVVEAGSEFKVVELLETLPGVAAVAEDAPIAQQPVSIASPVSLTDAGNRGQGAVHDSCRQV